MAHLAEKTRRPPALRFRLSGSFPNPHFWENPNPYYDENRKERCGMENGQENAGGLKRDVMIRFRVTEAERDFIFDKMRLLHTNNIAAYMRKMAIDGYAVNTDYSDLKAVCAEMQKIGVNFNQIAKRVNSTTRIYEQDIDEMKRGIAEIWRLLRLSLSKQG
jgi:hypothetical protein